MFRLEPCDRFDRCYHDCDEYWLLSAGRARVIVGSWTNEVGRGDIVCTPAGTRTVFKAYFRRDDLSRVRYCRHYAAGLNFRKLGRTVVSRNQPRLPFHDRRQARLPLRRRVQQEDRAPGAAYDSAEGGYMYVSGGPYNAREELVEHFPGADQEKLEGAVSRIEDEGYEWVKKGE